MFENYRLRKLIRRFYIKSELESSDIIIEGIEKGVEFKGTNLWILIFAIFVASLGLNINSTAVIIGAMLISPLMGPIIGLGLGIGINDFKLLKRSFNNYTIALITSLATSTLYFIISPLDEAHSEILARTSPTIYDVLIAFFGGMAGSIATTSRQKGNVIPGVAIATALMPPLCTAGYGLAFLDFKIFFGALYLFFINTVFIAIATLITVRFLKLPLRSFQDEAKTRRTKRIVGIIALVTILPSIYFGYKIVQQEKFSLKVKDFIKQEANFKNAYLLNSEVDAASNKIVLTFGGGSIDSVQIKKIEKKLGYYDLQDVNLKIIQGFTLDDREQIGKLNSKDELLIRKESEIYNLQSKLDSIQKMATLNLSLIKEIQVLYPNIVSMINTKAYRNYKDSTVLNDIIVIQSNEIILEEQKTKLEDWLKLRISMKEPDFLYEYLKTQKDESRKRKV